ncbi:DUF1566 domain-containing protein [Segnochrobactraceae bacterium EtOH-i3]
MRHAILLTGLLFLIAGAPAFAACAERGGGSLVMTGELAVDTVSRLVWKRCPVGMTWSDRAAGCLGDATGLTQEEARRAAAEAGPGWRLPTGEELETLIVDACSGLAIDTQVFPDIARADFGEGVLFWTSTEALPGMFYFFDFTNGYADMHSDGFRLSALLVRDR